MSEEENKASEYGNYRKLGQPADTVSGATADLFEVRPAGKPAGTQGSSTAFKVIAAIGIVAVLVAIAVTQFRVWA